MRKILITFISIVFTTVFWAQVNPSSGANYIHKKVYKKGYQQSSVHNATEHEKIEIINYFDGLGRPIQSVAIKQGGNNRDIVTPVVYDSYGRGTTEYLPFSVSANDGEFIINGTSASNSYYLTNYADDVSVSDPNPFSEKKLEASPLNRITKQAAPGLAWRLGGGHEVEFDYNTNTSSEVKKYYVTLSFSNNLYTPTLQLNGSYAAGDLIKSITKDENHTGTAKNRTTEEFKDRYGRVVLKRTYNANAAHDTYYVYDDYGNLTFVLPPKAEPHAAKPDATELSELCYQYRHDYRNRLVEKKIPGKGWEYIVYNKLNLPIMTQDQNLKTQNKWLATKYDVFGRVVLTGIKSSSGSRAYFQNIADTSTGFTQYETKVTSGTGYAGSYYSDTALPTGMQIMTINYYDNYVFNLSGAPTTVSVYGVQNTTNTKGLATGSKSRIIDTGNWITSVTYYDKLNRPIYTYSNNNYLSTTDIIESRLDELQGWVLETKMTHKKTGHADIVTYDYFEYNHSGELLNQKQYINEQEAEQIVNNQYDDLGQLKRKNVGGKLNTGQSHFKDLVNLTVKGNTITKTLNSTSWNAGLATIGEIVDDGYVEYQIPQKNKYLMVGLSSDNSSASFNTIDYAMYNRANGYIYVYEFGSYKKNLGVYNIGDIFRVERVGSQIYYKRNGVTLYTSTVSSSGKLIGDISIRDYNGKITNLHLSDAKKDYVGVSQSAGIITSTAGSGWNNSGFATSTSFAKNGYVEYQLAKTGKYFMAGLSNSNTNAHYNTIKYAIYHRDGNKVYVYESGSNRGQKTTANVGDIFRVERIGTKVYYKKNGNTFYTSTVNSSGALLGDVSFYHNQAKLKNFILRSSGLQTMDYEYNIRGWLTDINDVDNRGEDLFAFQIHYEKPTHSSAVDLFNGNISQVNWSTANQNTSKFWYMYHYDALNRIKKAQFAGGGIWDRYSLHNVNYDKNGNITGFTRKGHLNSGATSFGNMDILSYTYQSRSNKLIKVLDNGNDTYGFKDGANQTTEFTYDANGNMKTDKNIGITSITYNHLNLPKQVNVSGQNISYVYDASGGKLRKTVGGVNTDYAGNHIYENNTLQFFNHSEGYVAPSGSSFKYIYQYKDHLGNIRLSYSDSDNNGLVTTSEIVEENNYYPFGGSHKGYNNVVNGVDYPFGYNGKEEQNELGLQWLDYGARNYNKWLGKWMNIDPLAEKYTNLSPFSYVANNVINAIDPDGRLIIFVGGLRLKQGNADQRWWGKSGIYYRDVFNYWRTKPGEVNSFDQKADIVNTFARMHNDNHHLFTSGSSHWNSQASQRRSEGVRKAKKFYRMYKKGKVELADNETIKIVSHSQGGAHAAGFAEQLMTYKDADGNSLFNVEVIYYITPHQPGDITHPDGPQGFQWSYINDAVTNAKGWLSWLNGGSGHAMIKNLNNINQFFEGTILGGDGQPEATGATGNRNGHNVTDSQQNILKTLNSFCKKFPNRCFEIELVPNNANNN
ncbi:MAG: DUF6443 domain-containing protein [Flavobacteriaceae bacterium]|nr:DUF6443 domain-containing protein [Flavobacteriaceae bacterium]